MLILNFVPAACVTHVLSAPRTDGSGIFYATSWHALTTQATNLDSCRHFGTWAVCANGVMRSTQHLCNACACRNRQVQAFYDVIEWFNPGYVLMENVLDIFKKQDGMYAKFAASRLLNMRYQTRLGCIAACDQGAPQGRWRSEHCSTPLTRLFMILCYSVGTSCSAVREPFWIVSVDIRRTSCVDSPKSAGPPDCPQAAHQLAKSTTCNIFTSFCSASGKPGSGP